MPHLGRRRFLELAGAGALLPLLPATSRALGVPAMPTKERPIRRAVKLGMVNEGESLLAKFRLLAEIGYDGVEVSRPSGDDLDELIAARDATGLEIHGVVGSKHWEWTLGDPDPEVRAKGRAALESGLRDAKALGATSVLNVPAVVNASIRYDQAYERAQAELRQVVPLAEELGIDILFENVWNHFLLSPLEAARFVDELESERVGWYLDVGNLVRNAWPDHWVHALGGRIKKLDIKEYSRKKRDHEGLWKGFSVEIGEGDCGWSSVMAALDEIGFAGWATAEVGGGDADRLRDIHARMGRVLSA